MHPFATPPPATAPRLVISSDDSGDAAALDQALERELWLLRSICTFYETHEFFPFANSTARGDFCNNWISMTGEEFLQEGFVLRRKYYRRSKKNFQDLDPREQEALEMGRKIWRRRDTESRGNQDQVLVDVKVEDAPNVSAEEHKDSSMLSEGSRDPTLGSEDGRDPMLVSEDPNSAKEETEEEEEEDLLDQFPLVKHFFKTSGGINVPDPLKIPVLPNDVFVKEGLASLGTQHMVELTIKWRKIQLKQLDIFQKKLRLLKKQTLLLLSQIKDE